MNYYQSINNNIYRIPDTNYKECLDNLNKNIKDIENGKIKFHIIEEYYKLSDIQQNQSPKIEF